MEEPGREPWQHDSVSPETINLLPGLGSPFELWSGGCRVIGVTHHAPGRPWVAHDRSGPETLLVDGEYGPESIGFPL